MHTVSTVAAPSATVAERTTDHTIRYETWTGYNSTWKFFKMWADEAGRSFVMEQGRIEGRQISYPILLDANAEPMLESTNTFLIWYCEHCDIVTKKSVVEKAVSWLKACGDLARDKRGKGCLDK